ncbi:hypothetical protein [Streptomyces sp. N35]|uniref:hypothetical protein n=1 Tax=Streptomyces sp. N35 TaxID=2795730 RepID=UPI0018F7B316|nr:hypothetical protein [Streptomyces sp. N35]
MSALDLRDRIVQALLTTPHEGWAYEPGHEKWDHHKHGDRRGHNYSITCALCMNDVGVLADAVMAVLPAPGERYRLAWLSARSRAQAFGEGVHRLVADRDWWMRLARAMQARAVAENRATVLREAADAISRDYGAAAVRLRRMADETQPIVACNLDVLGRPHAPHDWAPQPGMAPVHCPAAATAGQVDQ